MDVQNKLVKIAKIKSDIDEIDEVLSAQFFDRAKAESIIHKHNTTDEVVGLVNSPLNPNTKPFCFLNDDTIRANLYAIREYFVLKLAKEQSNG